MAVLARIYVESLDAALPFYVRLSGGEQAHRFEFNQMKLAKVGFFLLIEGADDEVRSHSATIAVRDLGLVSAVVTAAGGSLVDGPAPGPNGARLIAKHPDGSILEYVELPSRR